MAQLRETITAGVTTGAVADYTQAWRKLNRASFDVVADYGATGDGSTNDTTSVQAAITAASAAGGGVVWFPEGTYLCGDVTWATNVTLLGTGPTSIIKKTLASSYLFTVNSGSSSVASNITNLTARGLTFRGTVDTDTTFAEQKHLLNLNGVSDVLIAGCQFVGWHGDAIYLGSGNTGGQERHNQRVKIVNNVFDGLTKNNRNCVSIIDGDDVLIQGNTSRRHTRSDMPGFVDVEPNSGNTFAVCRDIRVLDNACSDFLGTFFQCHLVDATYTTQPVRILVARNQVNAPSAVFAFCDQLRTATLTSARNDIVLADNQAVCTRPFNIGGLVGTTIRRNTFTGDQSALVGYDTNQQCFNTDVVDNTFADCARSDGTVINLIRGSYLTVARNRFDNCGLANGTFGQAFQFGTGTGSTGSSDQIDWIDNIITGTLMTAISAKSASHTITAAANNLKRAYRHNGLTLNAAHFGTAV